MAILTMILLVSPNVYIQSGCFFVLYIACLFSIHFDILHPYVWFIPLFTLYSIGYPLMHQQGYYAMLPSCGYVEANPYALFIHWCALCTFIITVTNKQVVYKNTYSYKINSVIVKAITLALMGILCFQIIMVIQSGFQTKREILDELNNELFFRLGKMANQMLPIFSVLLIMNKKMEIKKRVFWVISILIISFLEMIVIGERSAFIQILIVNLLAYNVNNQISLKKAFIAGAFVLLMIIVGVSMKASFGKNHNFSFLLSGEPLWVKLFNAEFSSASINTANILNHQKIWDYGYGLKYLLLIFQPFNFKPLSGLMKLLGYKNLFTISDNSLWYHDVILKGARSGYGFSMVADGYMELGILGVIILYLLLGIVVKKVYEKSSYSMLTLIFYVVLVPIFIYSTRATLLYLVNYLIKYILLPLVILSIFKVHRKNICYRRKSCEKNFH